MRYATALYDFLGSTEKKTLTIFQGDIIRVKEVTDAPWWLAECNGVLGFVPTSYVALKDLGWTPDVIRSPNGADEDEEDEDNKGFNNDADLTDEDDEDDESGAKAYSMEVVGTYNFDKKDPRHLPYRKGDRFYIVEPLTPDQPWFEARLVTGEVGLVPANRVYVLKPGETDVPAKNPAVVAAAATVAVSESPIAAKKSVVSKFPSRGIALKDYRSNEVNFTRGDVLDVEPIGVVGDWMSVRFNGKTGQIPRHYVRLLAMGSAGLMDDPMLIKNEFLYEFHTGNTQPESLFGGAQRDLRSLSFFSALFALKQTGGLQKNTSVEDELFAPSTTSKAIGKRVESTADFDDDTDSIGGALSSTAQKSNRLSMIVSSVRQRAQSKSALATAAAPTAATGKKSSRHGSSINRQFSGRLHTSNLNSLPQGEEVTDREAKMVQSQLRFHFFPDAGTEVSVNRQVYIVLEGEVRLKINNQDEMVFTAGEFFGLESLLENKRQFISATTAVVSSSGKPQQTILASLNFHAHTLLAKMLPWWEDTIRALSKVKSGGWLSHLSLFHRLDAKSLDVLGMRARIKQYKKGQTLETGEEGGLFIVFTGLLLCSVTMGDGTKRELRKIACGQFFGENTLFSQGVTLQTNTTCSTVSNQVMTLYLSNADMENFSAQYNSKARYNVARIARFRTGQVLEPLPFSQVLETKLDVLAQAFEFSLYEKDGDVIYEQNGNQCMYVLCEGEVELVQSTSMATGELETHKTMLRPGMWFGEKCLQYAFGGDGMNQSDNSTRETATAVGNNGALCIAVSYDTFARFLDTVAQEFRAQVKQKIDSMVVGLEMSSNTTMQFKNQLPTSADELACITQIPVEFLGADKEANAAIEAWAEIGSILAPCLKVLQGYPQYMHPFPFDFGDKDPLRKFVVTIIKVEEMDSIKVHTSAAETVGDLVNHVFEKFANLDPAGPSVFGLKVASRAEYLVERDVELGRYKCITSTLRRGEVLQLQLVDLRLNPKSGPGLRINKSKVAVPASPTLPNTTNKTSSLAANNKEVQLMEAVALYDYESLGGLSFKKGDRLEVEVRMGEAMWPATLFTSSNVQVVGQVPQNFIKALGPIYGGSGGGKKAMAAVSSSSTAQTKRGATSTVHTVTTSIATPLVASLNSPSTATRHQHTLLESTNHQVLLGLPAMPLEEWAQTVSSGFNKVERMLPCWGQTEVGTNPGLFPFRLRLRGLDRLHSIPRVDTFNFLQVRIEIVYAGLVIEKKLSRPMKKNSQTLRFEDEWLYFSMLCGELPLTTRLCLTLIGSTTNIGDQNSATIKKMASTLGGDYGGGGGVDDQSTAIPENSTDQGGGMLRSLFAKKPPSSSIASPSIASKSSPKLSSQSRMRAPSSSTMQDLSSGGKLLGNNGEVGGENGAMAEVDLAGVSLNLWQSDLALRGGVQSLGLWPGVAADRTLYCVENYEDGCSRIAVELDQYDSPLKYRMPASVHFPASNERQAGGTLLGEKKSSSLSVTQSQFTPAATTEKKKGMLSLGLAKRQPEAKKPAHNNRRVSMSVFVSRTAEEADKHELSKRVRELLHRNPLQVYQMSELDKQAIWNERELLRDNPMALSKVMISVNWLNPTQRNEALAMLQRWTIPAPMQALELLDARFGEYRVREYAVKCLEVFDDEELSDFLLQLIQVLKFEPYHDSPLCRFLFRRALANPREIGNKLFWGLRSEMHVKKSAPRFGLILKAYLKACGHHFAELAQQHDVQELLIAVGKSAQNLPKQTSKAERTAFAQLGMTQVNDRLASTKQFQLPLEPKMRGARFIPNKCRIMSSKKKPMWFTLDNVDSVENGGEPISLMLKCGDDLRQDQMTLQIFRVLEQIWLAEGMNLRLSPYGCISTGDEVGLLEIVKDSSTIAEIEVEWGGKFGSFKESPISLFLEHHNKQNVDQAIDNFVHSCAGYCVAAYVIGLGDRHNGNLMVAKDGRFFHIDFGHFLGNFKTAIGGTFKRERTPFVLTKGMVYAMGTRYPDFVELSCRALNIIRSHGDELVTLFRLMVPAGMPELRNDEDIQYLVDQLHLGKSDEETTQIFQKEIKAASGDFYKLIDNWLHTMKHQ
ncbi:hypothetical protein BASA81_008749 [Batrachochytrium salamandrivorans]|nr:hypothetical protein BASA81_008749 [Batrachochytrium salamandrivorans]